MTGQQVPINYHPRPRPPEPKKPRVKLVRGPVRKTWAERFEEFDKANPAVYRAIVEEAKTLKAHHCKRVGMKAIFEHLRRDYRLRTNGEEYKLNNSFTSHFSRKLIADYPLFAGLIETRESPGGR